jgi:hypothetical protein
MARMRGDRRLVVAGVLRYDLARVARVCERSTELCVVQQPREQGLEQLRRRLTQATVRPLSTRLS